MRWAFWSKSQLRLVPLKNSQKMANGSYWEHLPKEIGRVRPIFIVLLSHVGNNNKNRLQTISQTWLCSYPWILKIDFISYVIRIENGQFYFHINKSIRKAQKTEFDTRRKSTCGLFKTWRKLGTGIKGNVWVSSCVSFSKVKHNFGTHRFVQRTKRKLRKLCEVDQSSLHTSH